MASETGGKTTVQATDRPLPLPWERQPGESAKAYEAFSVYRDLGPARSLAAVGRSLGKSTVAMEVWSSKMSWVARAKLWDEHLEELAKPIREEIIKTQAEKWEKRREEALERRFARVMAIENYLDILIKSVTGADRAPKLTTTTLTKIAKLSYLLDRLVGGAVSDAMGGDDGFDPVTATPDQCRAYLEGRGVRVPGVRVPPSD